MKIFYSLVLLAFFTSPSFAERKGRYKFEAESVVAVCEAEAKTKADHVKAEKEKAEKEKAKANVGLGQAYELAIAENKSVIVSVKLDCRKTCSEIRDKVIVVHESKIWDDDSPRLILFVPSGSKVYFAKEWPEGSIPSPVEVLKAIGEAEAKEAKAKESKPVPFALPASDCPSCRR